MTALRSQFDLDSRRTEIHARAMAIWRRARRVDRARRAASGVAIAITLFIAFGGLDAVWPASAWLRAVFAAAVYGSAALAVWSAAVTARAARQSIAQAVGRAELRCCGAEGPARSAVELAGAGASDDGVTQALVERVLEQGLGRLRSMELSDGVDAALMRRSVMRAGVVALTILGITILAPRLVVTEALRLLDPFGDHPAYTSWRLSLVVDDGDLRVGDDVVVELCVEPEPPSAADAVLEISGAGIMESIPLRRDARDQAPGRFVATIRDVREPVRVRGRLENAMTRWRSLEPAARPRVRTATMTLAPPSYTNQPAQTWTLPLDQSPVALVGAEVRLDLEISLAIAAVEAPGAERTMAADQRGSGIWRAEEVGALPLEMNVRTASGEALDAPMHAAVEVVVDAPPRLTVRAPQFGGRNQDQALATPTSGFEFEFVARDDVAVAALGAQWRRVRGAVTGEWNDLKFEISNQESGMRGRGAFSMEHAGAAVGDRIELRFLARDNRPAEFGGANIAVAGPFAVDVISPDSHAALAPGLANAIIPAQSDDESGEDGAAMNGEGRSAGEPSDERAPGSGADVEGPSSDAPSSGEGSAAGADGRTSSGDATRDDGGSAGRQDGEASEQASGAGDATPGEERSAAPGDWRAVDWGTPQGGAPAAIDPEILNQLPRRARELIERYYELMAQPEES